MLPAAPEKILLRPAMQLSACLKVLYVGIVPRSTNPEEEPMFKRTFAIFAAMLMLSIGFSAQISAQPKDEPKDEPGARREMPRRNPNAGFFGAKLQAISDDQMEELKLDSNAGIVLMEIMKDSPAEKAGLKADDVIRKIDGNDIEGVEDFVSSMEGSKPGQEVKFTIIRAQKEQEVKVVLGKRPTGFGEAPAKEREPSTKPN